MENFVINIAREPQKFESFLKLNGGCQSALKRTFPAFNFDCILNDVYPKIDAYASYPPLVLPKNDRNVSTTIKE